MHSRPFAWFAAAWTIAACGGESSEPKENTPAACADGRENDGDGLVDCVDPDCDPHCSADGDADADGDGDCDVGGWVTERIGGGWGSSMAVGDDGVVHVAYSGGYGERLDGVWQYDDLDTDSYDTDIELDADGEPVIAHLSADLHQTLVTRRVAGQWETEIADEAQELQYVAVAIDGDGNLHVVSTSYVGNDRSSVRYATNASGQWQVDTVNPYEFQRPVCASLALDASDAAHIASGAAGWMHHLTNESGDWEERLVAGPSEGDYGCSIEVLDDGTFRMFYKREGQIAIATENELGFDVEDVPVVETPPLSIGNLVEDEAGGLHFAYSAYDASSYGPLKHASKVRGVWEAETVDDAPSLTPSFVLRGETLHLTWSRVADGDVYYGRLCP